jgi:hypothetical protein
MPPYQELLASFALIVCVLPPIVPGQAKNEPIKICKGIAIPEGYTILEETTSADCTKGAYLIKKSNEAAPSERKTDDNAGVNSKKPDQKPAVDKLYQVQRIFIGEMGKSDDSERFRLLVSERLSKKGFSIVDSPSQADAILDGVISTQLRKGTTLARASVYLKTSTGTLLWSREEGVHFKWVSTGHPDSVRDRAGDLADHLLEDWRKSAKAAGIKPDK